MDKRVITLLKRQNYIDGQWVGEPALPVTNPATGEEIKIPAKRVVKFRVSKKAKDAILGVKK